MPLCVRSQTYVANCTVEKARHIAAFIQARGAAERPGR